MLRLGAFAPWNCCALNAVDAALESWHVDAAVDLSRSAVDALNAALVADAAVDAA
jgi:hypothetical protein